jgi:hydroxyethylthiazole kinase-like uncharacterized protein yjeF
MKVVTAAAMRVIEEATYATGLVTPPGMMERAGRGVADTVRARCGALTRPRVLALVGPGNNGGDALVAIRYLVQQGAHGVAYLTRPREDDPNVAAARAAGVVIELLDTDTHGRDLLRNRLWQADIVLDGLLGMGTQPPVRGAVREVLQVVAETPPPHGQLRVAIDVPSGTDSDTGAADPLAFRAHLTVATGLPKPAHYFPPAVEFCGEVVTVEIGLLAERVAAEPVEALEDAQVGAMLPARPRWSHKGTFGRALVIAGSRTYIGAAFLATAAALRAGAGLVTLAAPAFLPPIVAQRLAEATFLPLTEETPGVPAPAAVHDVLEAAARYDALLIGPGLGQHPNAAALLRQVLAWLRTQSPQSRPKLVIDADGLNLLAREPDWPALLPPESILTPHPGELGRLAGLTTDEIMRDRLGLARARAAQWSCILVSKGAPSVIAAPDGRTAIIPIATPALATAGTGDVLAGTVCGLLAQGIAPFEAAAAAAYVHAQAGLELEHEIGLSGPLAGDLLPKLPLVMTRLRTAAALPGKLPASRQEESAIMPPR